MEHIMKAKEFFKNLKVVLSKKEEFKTLYHDNTRWTGFIKGITEEMIGKNCISREYYRIDSLKYQYTDFYQSYDKDNHRKYFGKHYLSTYNWKNIYAIEYENDSRNWTDELVKLSHIRSDLKVIIAYSEWNGSRENYLSLIDKKMTFAIELLENCQKEALNDKWLIIFGPCGSAGKEEYDKDLISHFIGYEMNDGHFVKIEE